MMKRAVSLVVVLLLATSAFAGVTVVCNQVDTTDVIEVNYEMDGGDPNLPRAFSLDISVDNGATIGSIYNFDPNYYVAPGTYDYNQTTGDVCDWGNPIVDLASSSFTCEMGSLYAAGDPYGHTIAPQSSGTLFMFTVSGDCTVTLEENAARAGVDSNGVVMEDTEKSFAVSYVTLSSCSVAILANVPDVIGMTENDANTTLTGDGFAVAKTYAWNAATQDDVYGQNPVGGSSAPPGSTVTIDVSRGPQPANPMPAGAAYDEQRAVANTYITNLWDPSIWATVYHCHGDADGVNSGFPYNYRIYYGDLNLVVVNWKKLAAAYPNGADPEADVDHKNSGFPYSYLVYYGDLNRIVNNWKDTSPPLPATCPLTDADNNAYVDPTP